MKKRLDQLRERLSFSFFFLSCVDVVVARDIDCEQGGELARACIACFLSVNCFPCVIALVLILWHI